MKYDEELYDQARDEMLTDMLDYISADLIAEVLADEWVLSKNPVDFEFSLHGALCDCPGRRHSRAVHTVWDGDRNA